VGDWEAKCLVFKPGTYVSVANKGAFDLQARTEYKKHKTAVRREMSLTKVFLLHPEACRIMLY